MGCGQRHPSKAAGELAPSKSLHGHQSVNRLRYPFRMDNAWQTAIALLLGTHPVPAVQWPATQTRIVIASDSSPDDEPEEIVISEAERAVLELVAAAPLTSRQVYAAVDEKPATVQARLYRMKGRGLLVRERKAWRVADSLQARSTPANC